MDSPILTAFYVGIFLLMALYTAWYLWRKKKRESATDRIGAAGERLMASQLKKIAGQYGWTVLNNVYLPLYDKTTQIDHLIVGEFGVLVVETKHISGVIYGDAASKNWKQDIGKKHNTLYNPLLQNKAHLDCLSHHLKKAGLKNVSVSGVVVFSAKDAYLNLPKGLPVVTMDRLPDFLKRSSFHARSKTDPQEVLRAIRAVQVTDRAVIRRHEAGVKEMAKRGGR